jgi:hypothetical protein
MTLKTISRQSSFYYVQWQAINYFCFHFPRTYYTTQANRAKE